MVSICAEAYCFVFFVGWPLLNLFSYPSPSTPLVFSSLGLLEIAGQLASTISYSLDLADCFFLPPFNFGPPSPVFPTNRLLDLAV